MNSTSSPILFSPHLIPPRNLFIEMTTECNYKCKYCHLWKTRERADSLSTQEKMDLLEQFKKLNSNGEVILTGGETMLKTKEFFELCRKCIELELSCINNTNGSMINDSNINELLTSGPSSIVFSLDSHISSIHDFSRGVKGSFVDVTTKIDKILQERNNRESDGRLNVLTNSVIFEENIYLIKDYIKFAEDIGIDGVMFQILSRTFANSRYDDYFFDNHFVKDKIKARTYIHSIIETLGNHEIVKTTKNDFEWMTLYIDNPDFISEQVCGSHEKNIMIDCYGEVQLCFNFKEIMNGNTLGNIRDKPLSAFWNAPNAEHSRTVMNVCRKNCGMLNCHRKSYE